MPVRSRPIRPDLLISSEEEANKSAKRADLKKYNYTSLFIDNGLDLSNFSFFGDHTSKTDYIGNSTNLLYGRVDGSGDAISPRLNLLSPIGDHGSTRLAINFVSQAFNEFRARFVSERSGRNALKIRTSNYNGLNPAKSFVNVNTLHSQKLEQTFQEEFIPFATNSVNNTNLNTFHDFLQLFIGDFLSENMLEKKRLSLLRSSFAISNESTPLISGMVIDLSETDHNNDKSKFDDWINSPAYQIIRTGAANHGFIIDKHAPWRFIANLNSPRLLNFIQGKKLLSDPELVSRFTPSGKPYEADDVYPAYYEKIYLKDIEILKLTLLNLYNNFISLKKYVSMPMITKCAPSFDEIRAPSISIKRKTREKYTMGQLESDYPPDFWLNQYLILRLLEGGVRINDERLYRQFKKISQINKYLSYSQALTYVNEYAKLYTGFVPDGAKGINSVAKFAFSKTANPQVTGVAKSIAPPEETVGQ